MTDPEVYDVDDVARAPDMLDAIVNMTPDDAAQYLRCSKGDAKAGIREARKAVGLPIGFQGMTPPRICMEILERAKRGHMNRRSDRVYVVQCAANDLGPVKIGYSMYQMGERLRSMQTGCPYPLVAIRELPADRETEADLHERFAEYRMHGEWFRCEEDVAWFVSILRDM